MTATHDWAARKGRKGKLDLEIDNIFSHQCFF